MADLENQTKENNSEKQQQKEVQIDISKRELTPEELKREIEARYQKRQAENPDEVIVQQTPEERKKVIEKASGKMRSGVAIALAIVSILTTIFAFVIWAACVKPDKEVASVILLVLFGLPSLLVSIICSLICLIGNIVVLFTGKVRFAIIFSVALSVLATVGNVYMVYNFFTLVD